MLLLLLLQLSHGLVLLLPKLRQHSREVQPRRPAHQQQQLQQQVVLVLVAAAATSPTATQQLSWQPSVHSCRRGRPRCSS